MASETRQPFVRPYEPKDLWPNYVTCQKTVGDNIKAGPPGGLVVAPYIWSIPYNEYHPEHCFVVDDGSGTAVGYIISAPNTSEFVKTFRQKYIPSLEERDPLLKQPAMEPAADWEEDLVTGLLQTLYNPEAMLHEDQPDFLKEYPAHLHIDILPEYQRQGLGRKLMEALWAKLKDDGIPGVHLIMWSKNYEAKKFYLRIGFKPWPVVMDNGKSGEVGYDDHDCIWLCKKFD